MTGINSSGKYASGDIAVLTLDKGSSQCIDNSSLGFIRKLGMTAAHFPKVFQIQSICTFSEIEISRFSSRAIICVSG
jgi:hypothetical protein